MMSINFLSCIRGYHALCREMRMVVIGEQLLCERKPGLNAVDRYAMAMKDSCVTVGHHPSHQYHPQKIAVLKEEVR